MRILVTGANGYLGTGIVSELLDAGCEAIAADQATDRVDERAKKVQCDIFATKDPYCAFEEPDVLLHLAWRNGFVHNSQTHLIDLPKHYEFIEKMVKSGIKRIAVMGTMHEVGFYEGCIRESTPCNPQSLYGIAKNALRESVVLLSRNSGIPLQWIRGFYIVGTSAYGSSIFSKIVQASLRGDATFPFTMGRNQWDFIDYSDFCKQVSSIVKQDKINGIINACSGFPEKLSERVERFIRNNNYNIKLEYGAFPDRPYDSKAVWGDDSRVKEIMESDEQS